MRQSSKTTDSQKLLKPTFLIPYYGPLPCPIVRASVNETELWVTFRQSVLTKAFSVTVPFSY